MPPRPLALSLAAAALLALVGCSTSAGVEPSPAAVSSEPATSAAASSEPATTCPDEMQDVTWTGFEGPPPGPGPVEARGGEVGAAWSAVTGTVAAPLPEGVEWPAAPPAPLDGPCVVEGHMGAIAGTIEITAGLWWRCQWLDALVVEAGVSWPSDLPDPVAAGAQLDTVLADPAIAPVREAIPNVIASTFDEMDPSMRLVSERTQCSQHHHL